MTEIGASGHPGRNALSPVGRANDSASGHVTAQVRRVMDHIVV